MYLSGNCMRGTIEADVKIAVRRDNNYKLGDVVVFRNEERLLAHRIIGCFRREGVDKVLTHGDHNLLPDRPLLPDEIIGRVISADGIPIEVSTIDRIRATIRFLYFSVSYFATGKTRRLPGKRRPA